MCSLAVAACVAENLRRYRKQAGLSQEGLNFRVSLHRTAVGQLERAERTARADTLVKLAGALAIFGDLLEGLPGESRGRAPGALRDWHPRIVTHSGERGELQC
jgi:transcriptional regulator with XRE-family HTH domain